MELEQMFAQIPVIGPNDLTSVELIHNVLTCIQPCVILTHNPYCTRVNALRASQKEE
jgi:hypothetical protein